MQRERTAYKPTVILPEIPINQEFLLHEWPDVAFVNREEDTGDEGLRKAKMSYHPVALVKKYKGVYQG